MRLVILFLACDLIEKGQNQSLPPKKEAESHVTLKIPEALWIVL